ncbi:MAG: hypothetical protein E7H33_08975 [Clostridium perfringens]|uniref:hypothetical protein n=1 Tax=Clostridium perfringens TaxID=1502 RepID=UPI002911360B|nr:hypothetical protein [Clostridium perfringens]MDU4051034.1 hypothetical protein [Clostridium perfringens]
MKKQDLKIGHVIKQRNGYFGIVVGENIISGKNGYSLISRLSNDLIHMKKRSYDIIEVFEISQAKSIKEYVKGRGLKSIWKREEI